MKIPLSNMAILETVKINNPKGEGFVIVNATDFNSETMSIFQEKKWANVLGAVNYTLEDSIAQLGEMEATTCAFTKANGERCKGKPLDNGFCFQKAHQPK